jgi:hypothetical protein
LLRAYDPRLVDLVGETAGSTSTNHVNSEENIGMGSRMLSSSGDRSSKTKGNSRGGNVRGRVWQLAELVVLSCRNLEQRELSGDILSSEHSTADKNRADNETVEFLKAKKEPKSVHVATRCDGDDDDIRISAAGRNDDSAGSSTARDKLRLAMLASAKDVGKRTLKERLLKVRKGGASNNSADSADDNKTSGDGSENNNFEGITNNVKSTSDYHLSSRSDSAVDSSSGGSCANSNSGNHDYSDYYECEVELVTGRTHQIRLQFSAVGSPIVGDTRYEPVAGLLDDTGDVDEHFMGGSTAAAVVINENRLQEKKRASSGAASASVFASDSDSAYAPLHHKVAVDDTSSVSSDRKSSQLSTSTSTLTSTSLSDSSSSSFVGDGSGLFGPEPKRYADIQKAITGYRIHASYRTPCHNILNEAVLLLHKLLRVFVDNQ